jgi:hypothetical protein
MPWLHGWLRRVLWFRISWCRTQFPSTLPLGLVTIPLGLWQRPAERHLNSRAKGVLRTWLVHGFPTF